MPYQSIAKSSSLPLESITSEHVSVLKRSGMSIANAIAVVVGVCGHGLSVTRALADEGVKVIALEHNPELPGCATNSATVRMVKDIHGMPLIRELLALRKEISRDTELVLFLTNDKMVQFIAENWSLLEGYYQLSWAKSRNYIKAWLDKGAIEARCNEVGLHYPRSTLIENEDMLDVAMDSFVFPVIVKPTKPLSSFKVYIAHTAEQLKSHCHQYAADFPHLVQTYIPGDDRSIYFGAFMLQDGKVLGSFEGRKLFSRPMGHTTLAEPCPNQQVRQMALRFFEGLNISGPVSVEFKLDQEGRYWVIEPTVGRTDYWIGLCIANRLNIPALEFISVHKSSKLLKKYQQTSNRVWVNGERDPMGLIRLALIRPSSFFKYIPCFLYFSMHDIKPFWRISGLHIKRLPSRIVSRIKKVFR